MWKKDQVVVKAVLVLYGSQPVTRRVWKSVGAVVLVLYGSQPVTRRAWKSVGAVVKAMAALHRVQQRRFHKRDYGSSDDASPTSDVSLEGNQAGSRYGCLLWLIRIMSVGLEPAKTRDGNVACVPHLLRGHRSQAVQDHRDCFPVYSRLCRYRLGHDFTCS